MRVGGLLSRIVTVLLSVVFLAALPAGRIVGGEVIRSFDSSVEIRADGTQVVRETIRVLARGEKIKRGIYRDFPLPSRRVSFKVLSLSIDGVGTRHYAVNSIAGGVRVTMGDKNRLLPHGEHTYVLTYETSGHLRFFDENCEFGWNVTGNAWDFVIEEATCRVSLPEGGEVADSIGWIGRKGARDAPIIFSRPDARSALFIARQQIRPREHFTVAMRFPRELVADPERWRWLYPLLAVMLSFAFFFVTWRLWGKDPEAGAIIPRFYPPEAGFYGKAESGRRDARTPVSPAAAVFVKNVSRLNQRGFASLYISLAARGLCGIGKNAAGDFAVTPRDAAGIDFAALPEEEASLYASLAEAAGVDREFVLTGERAAEVVAMRDRVIAILRQRYEPLWKKNLLIRTIGWLLVFPATLLIADAGDSMFTTLLAPALLAVLIHLVRRQITIVRERPIAELGPLAVIVFVAVAASFFVGWGVVDLLVGLAGAMYRFVMGANPAVLALVAIPSLFCHEMKAPTPEGRRLLDEIDGLLLYINTAERGRLQALNPPADTPETFERILPYAAAFGLEKTWCARFASTLAALREDGTAGDDTTSVSDMNWLLRSDEVVPLFTGSLTRAAVSSSTSDSDSSSGYDGSFFDSDSGGGAGSGGGGGGGGGW